ncbi:MAG TPA: hypothetical protein VMJ11_05920 [Paraburkholderia sp.]|uniref:hypothetical protein n=1 Tax=Paraburkholderia sp. TaxID=1926495 RepID=UPI002D012B67|nr:hypothetical protein [Paraburkholderia sp.]HTR06189.1 hypothetical protein [Paraburkholderia sp.]
MSNSQSTGKTQFSHDNIKQKNGSSEFSVPAASLQCWFLYIHDFFSRFDDIWQSAAEKIPAPTIEAPAGATLKHN